MLLGYMRVDVIQFAASQTLCSPWERKKPQNFNSFSCVSNVSKTFILEKIPRFKIKDDAILNYLSSTADL